MKVLFLCPSLVGAGVERRVCILLRELDKGNLDFRLGLLRAEGEFLHEVPADRLLYIPPKPWLKRLLRPFSGSRDFVNCMLGIFQIRAMLRNIGPDIVVSFTLETTIPTYFALSRNSAGRIAWMISEDSNTAAATAETCGPVFIARLVQSLLGRVYRRATHINCVSRAVEHAVRQVYRVDPARLSSLSNPVDIRTVDAGIREWQDSPNASEYILGVGRLVPIKRFDLLIRAFAEIRKHRRIRLLILGEGPERAALKGLAEALGLQHDVVFQGFVPNPWHYMARAKMLVLTSKLEGFGNVILEAMTAGCPVIATRCGGPEDVIRHGSNGLMVGEEPRAIAAAMERLLRDCRLSRTLAARARIDAQNYAPDKISAQFDALLHRVAVDR